MLWLSSGLRGHGKRIAVIASSEGRQMAQTFEATRTQPPDPAHYAESSARENLIEHVFLGELLRGLPQQTFWSRLDHCDVSSASDQAACLARSATADEALPSLTRYTRPLSVCSETRLSPSFLRTTPARKPRTECCCQSVADMIAAIVAPAGVRSIAMMRACLVSVPAASLDDVGADRGRDLALLVFRAIERIAAFGLDFGLVMGSSEVCATPSVAPPQPHPGKAPKQG